MSLSFTAVAVLAVAVLCTSFIFGPLTVGSVIAGVNFNYNTMQIIFLPVIVSVILYLSLDQFSDSVLMLLAVPILIIRIIFMLSFDRTAIIRTYSWLISNLLSIVFASLSFSILNKYSSHHNLRSWAIFAILFMVLFVISQYLFIRNPEGYYQNEMAYYFYHKYKRKYTNIITKEIIEDPLLKKIFFTIMVVEEMNRPSVFRLFERLAFFTGKIKTTGLMQVTSPKYLSNEESIILAQKIVIDAYNESEAKEYELSAMVRHVAYAYNPSEFYSDLIENAYDYISSV